MRSAREPTRFLVIAAGACLSAAGPAQGSSLYVDDDAPAGGDGRSWQGAVADLQMALAIAAEDAEVDEIRIAGGTYKPAGPGGDRNTSFQPSAGLSLRGGYAGMGANDPDERDIETHETILSGDLNGDDGPDFANRGDNSHALIDVTSDDVLIHGLKAYGAEVLSVHVDYSLPTGAIIDQCTFFLNRGGALRAGTSNPSNALVVIRGCRFFRNKGRAVEIFGNTVVDRCVLIENEGIFGAGAIHVGFGNPLITDSSFISNTAPYGGGVLVDDASLCMIRCIFAGNIAGIGGGALYYYESFVDLRNCAFVGNTAVLGGALYESCDAGFTWITNCSVVENRAAQIGGAGSNCSYPHASVSNSIFWGNEDDQGFDEHAQLSAAPGALEVNYSNIQGLTGLLGGTGNIGLSPQFRPQPAGYWTADALFDATSMQTTLSDMAANWTPGQLVGTFLKPDAKQARQSLVVANTATEITVWGDFSAVGLAGVPYKIRDIHLQPTSPCIDGGDPLFNPSPKDSIDIDGELRVVGCRVDIGADEVPVEIADPPDMDSDGLTDNCDNCPLAANINQTDADADGYGDACDTCPVDFNPDQSDGDGDGFGDLCDPCPMRRPGDVSGDMIVSELDVTGFVRVLLRPSSSTYEQHCAANVNGDSAVNALDIQPFVDLLVAP